ncbi:broad-complex core protein isoform X1 [Drosophila tropicalis]|uniref:broad-complex core protein isoform X1 n=1 Tax=Drosophila tropicalis TaxID=46794 RepID=UPI0035ABF9C7
MDDEFKLCWKNFQDNIASGFQNLYDRGDLVDVTLACDGKLLQAHKIVLAICSPYFQEIFTTNPCQHPIIILKDVSFNIMCELLEFMYQGVVNVKHTELQSFMKIGQLLQIKGLATNSTSPPGSSSSEKSTSQGTQPDDAVNNNNNNGSISKTDATDPSESKLAPSTPSNSRATSPGGSSSTRIANNDSNHLYSLSKRSLPSDFNSDSLSICSRKQLRRSLTNDHGNEGSDNADTASMDNNPLNAEEFFLPPIPHISMVEPRYDLGLKRETEMHHGPPSAAGGGSSGPAASSGSTAVITPSLRNPFGPNFNLDYNFYKANNNNSSNNNGGPGSSSSNASGSISSGNGNGSGGLNTEYPNDLYMPNDYTKNFANHMDIPPNGSNMVMLSTTSLLHGNCVFNRNNTVATQQGMKTYWLCKSYRISMCRARCITHLGRIISATGVHNHTPHMRGGQAAAAAGGSSAATSAAGSGGVGASPITVSLATNPNVSQAPCYTIAADANHLGPDLTSGSRLSGVGGNIFAHQTAPIPPPPPPSAPLHHHLPQSLPNLVVQHHPASHMEQHGPPTSLMHNPNLMHLPMQPHHQHQHPHHQQQHSPHNHHAASGAGPSPSQHHLELSSDPSVLLSPAHMQQPSPQSTRSTSLHAQESPLGMKSPSAQQQSSAASVDDQQQQQQQHVDINANGDGSAESSSATAHVIDSITISPSSRHGHSFKMENM